MSTDSEHYYITTPIYYVNDMPHIGHAYTTLACDVLARYHRSVGKQVRFLTGTDEHGQKVEKAAISAGVSPKIFTDEVSTNFRQLLEVMNFSHDDFIRTTEDRHRIATQALWKKIADAGDIYLGSYAGWYAVRDEAYYDEHELTMGVDGKKIAPSGASVEWVEEPSYFFRLSRFQDRLLDHYQRYPETLRPRERSNEVLAFIRSGLNDLSISRTTFCWGIPVETDPTHVVYVWLDALTNYITALGFPDVEQGRFQKFWPVSLHMVGKDIIRFHAVYWPAFLMSAGLPLPKRIFAHGWWTNEGQKISKTLGNVIDPVDLVKEYGLDAVRYFLLREVTFGQDGDFSTSSMMARINHDLANDYGNLCQRVLTMVQKNCAGLIPKANLNPDDLAVIELCRDVAARVDKDLAEQQFSVALQSIWQGFSRLNGYIDRQAPWVLRKTDPARMETVLYTLMEGIRRLTILVDSFIPNAAERIFNLMNVPFEARTIMGMEESLTPGVALPNPQAVFPRYEPPAADAAKIEQQG